MNDETERIKRARVDRSFVTLGGIEFLVRRPAGEGLWRCVSEALEAQKRMEEARDPAECSAAEDIFWRRMLVDHLPGFEMHYPRLKGTLPIEEVTIAIGVVLGIPMCGTWDKAARL